jgi:hypothetical protein
LLLDSAEYGRLSADYAIYLVAKLNFQIAHRDIDGTIALDKWLENHKQNETSALYVERRMTDLLASP